MERVRVLKNNPEHKISTQMYEVFNLNEAKVARKITIELNKSQIVANKAKSVQISMIKIQKMPYFV
jgi:hypothetical protein